MVHHLPIHIPPADVCKHLLIGRHGKRSGAQQRKCHEFQDAQNVEQPRARDKVGIAMG